MSNYRNPDNYGFSYTEKTRSIEELTKDVKELEEKGPGPEGKIDYETQVQNKPKINDEELSGNKTSDDLHIKGSQPKVEGENLIFS